MSVVEQICTRVAILDSGAVAEEGEVSKVFAAPQSEAAKRLVYPDGYEQSAVVFDPGSILRVVFNGANAAKTPLIAQMAMDEKYRRQHPLRLAPAALATWPTAICSWASPAARRSGSAPCST